jgi:tetratricopeptide (TPR) repeat protein
MMQQRATLALHTFSIIVLFACFRSDARLFAQAPPQASQAFLDASEAMKHGDLNTAARGFASVVKSDPSFAEAHFNLGLVLQEQGHLQEAVASFEKALTLKPRLHGANLFLAVAQYKLGHFDQARTAARKETAAYPRDASAWMWLGIIEIGADRPQEAAAALDKAAQLSPGNVDILYHRGQAHLLVSKESYARMLQADPKSWRILQVLAEASSDADRPLESISEYEAAIKLVPTQPGLHDALGAEYRAAGKMQEAEAAFQRELEIDPFNASARYKLGILAIDRGDGAKAKEFIEAALRQMPGMRHADYNLGRAEMLLGDDAAALQHLQRATTAAGSDPDVVQQAWYQLGIAYRRLRRMDEARAALAMFQKLKDEQAETAVKRREARQPPDAAQPPPDNPQ